MECERINHGEQDWVETSVNDDVEIKEELMDLTVHCDPTLIQDDDMEEVGVNEDVDIKEELIDLTVHCEPTLIEDEDTEEEDSFHDSLALEEECVDPLEFLEVDQTSVAESLEDELTEGAENKKHNEQETAEVHNLESKQESSSRGLSSSYKMCEKCKKLQNVTSYSGDPEAVKSSDGSSEEELNLCNCEKDDFKCKVCKKVIKKVLYESHMQRHEQIKKYACDICGKTFLHPVYLRHHAATHLQGKEHYCDVCEKSFKHLKTFNHHKVTCTKKKYYQCSACGESFPLKRPLIIHMRTHEKESEGDSLNCEICCIVFDSSSSKREHIMEVHVAAQRFVCGTCGEAFVTECAMKRHVVAHSRSYPCKMCEATFSKRHDLFAHRLQHRKIKDLRCKTCDREFEQISAYTEHKLSQSCSEEKAVCELCEKSFKDKPALKKHIMVHIPLSERSVDCEICSRSFCGVSALRKHVRLIHAGTRPYTCEFCSKSFNQLCKLKYHIVSHASDKPVTCEVCNKGFSNDKDIKIHMRTHTGEKPFKCDLCNKTFRQRGHVKTHQVVHTKEKAYTCDICQKSFGLPSSLKKHIKLHSANILITTR